MNKVNFKCWSDTVRTEGNGSRLHAIRTIFCHTADSQERAEIVETLQKIAQEHFKDASQAQQQDNQPVAWRLSYFKKGEKPATWNDNACDRPKLFLDEELANGKLDEVHTFERIDTAFIEPLYLQSQAQQSQWISVEERLPEKFVDVLVHPRPTDYICEAAWLGDAWYWSDYELNFGVITNKCVVTHWMPLPPAPEGDKTK